MPAPYSSLMSCSLGTTEFQCTDFSVDDQPVLRDNFPVGRQIKLSIQGTIAGTSAADFAAKLAAFHAATAGSGEICTISGLGGNVLYTLHPAVCTDGGPHVSVKQEALGSTSALSAKFSLEVNGKTELRAGDKAAAGQGTSNKIEMAIRVDNNRDLQLTGSLVGSDMEANLSTLLTDATAAYPWPSWKVSWNRTDYPGGERLDYTISIEQMSFNLPGNNVVTAKDGTFSKSMERNAEGARTRTFRYDLVCDRNNALALVDVIRADAAAAGGPIISETIEVGGYKENRLRASFTVLEADWGDDIVSWSETVTAEGEEECVEPVKYDGVGVVFVWQRSQVFKFTHTGRAVGIKNFPDPAIPIEPTGYFQSAPREITHESPDNYRYQTSWRYQYVGSSGIGDAPLALMIANLGSHK